MKFPTPWRKSLRRCRTRLRLAAATRARFEFVPRDAWVGVFCKWSRPTVDCEWWKPGCRSPACRCMTGTTTLVETPRLYVWVCVLPCLPLHVWWVGPRRLRFVERRWRGEPNADGDTPPEAPLRRALALAN